MSRIKYLIILFIILTLGCTDDIVDPIGTPVQPKIEIELISFDVSSASFTFTLDPTIENTLLIWSNNPNLDIDNKIGSLEISQSTSELSVTNLNQGGTYYFRLVGEFNNEFIYSEIIQLTLSDIVLTEYRQILNSVSYPTPIEEILKLEDGYLFITGGAIINVSKITNDLNLLWSFDITSSTEDLFYKGVYKLNENNEYLMLIQGLGASNSDPWGNQYRGDVRAHGVKFNDDGQIIWNRDYSTYITDNYYVNTDDYPIPISRSSEKNKVFICSDSTYYTENDEYYRALTFDSDGELSSSQILNPATYSFRRVLFKLSDKWINYGIYSGDIHIQLYNSNNELTHDYLYGNNGAIEYLSKNILDQGDTIVLTGTNGHENSLDGESRWIFNINASNGEIIWEIKESEENYSYRAKDLIKDSDENYLSLFFDMYNMQNTYPFDHDYNYATLIKSDNDGNILWKFVDGDANNDDDFEPERVFQQDNEYLIFGRKPWNEVWVKKIKIE